MYYLSLLLFLADLASTHEAPVFYSQDANFVGTQPLITSTLPAHPGKVRAPHEHLEQDSHHDGFHKGASGFSGTIPTTQHDTHQLFPRREVVPTSAINQSKVLSARSAVQQCRDLFQELERDFNSFSFIKTNNTMVKILEPAACKNMTKDLKLALIIRLMLSKKRDPKEFVAIFLELNRPLVQDAEMYAELSTPPQFYPGFVEYRGKFSKEQMGKSIKKYYTDLFKKHGVEMTSQCLAERFSRKAASSTCKSFDANRYLNDNPHLRSIANRP